MGDAATAGSVKSSTWFSPLLPADGSSAVSMTLLYSVPVHSYACGIEIT
jgi:hypothetical protein